MVSLFYHRRCCFSIVYFLRSCSQPVAALFLSAIKIISYSVYSYKNISHTPEERRKARFLNKSSATAIKYLRKIEDLPHKPEALKPFTDVLNTFSSICRAQ